MIKRKRQEKISFKVHIQLDSNIEKQYSKGFYSGMDDFEESELRKYIDELIREMKDEFNRFADNSIEEVKLDSVYEGSIIALFTVVWNVATTLNDAYDICKMVREVSELFLKKRLKEKFKHDFRVDTYDLTHSKGYWYERNIVKKKEVDYFIPYRDAFFYFLLVSNIVQAFIIAALVLGAVMKVYF